MTRCSRFLLSAFCLLLTAYCLLPIALGQSATATLSGTVADQNGALVPAANVTVTNTATSSRRSATTNEQGYFTVPLLPPSTYTVRFERDGFAPLEVPSVILNVGDQKSLQIHLKAGNITEMVQIAGDAALINESPAVATVIDRQFVENLPLNGRTFHSLIALTPGVNVGFLGGTSDSMTFSVNGQRPTSNYFMVDGVSANMGSTNLTAMSSQVGGANVAVTASGGTQALVTLDGMQEFTIQTSTYAPKFGRQPGAQVSIVSRSGSNAFTGTAFEYFRNDALDANDWFANRAGLPKPPLRQNDFGGVFGGPIVKNKTFFFGSYEGLRLRVPMTQVYTVASQSFRNTAHPQVRPILDYTPLPNGRSLSANTGEFVAVYSDPQTLDAYSIRLDQIIGKNLTMFGRYHTAPSSRQLRSNSPAKLSIGSFSTQTLTVGATWSVTQRTANDIRINHSRSKAGGQFRSDSFGDATPLDKNVFLPSFVDPDTSQVSVSISGIPGSFSGGPFSNNLQRQINVVDDFSFISGNHRWELGADYRYLYPHTEPFRYFLSITVLNAQTAQAGYSVTAREPATFVFHNFSLYGQDTWKVTPRFTLTYGLRWELVPPPRASEGAQPLTLDNLDNLSQVAFAAPGAKVWETTYGNFAPRIGLAYTLANHPGRETVLRGGFGVFYDLGYANFGNFITAAPYTRTQIAGTVTMPINPALLQPPPVNLSGPISALSVFARDLQLPYTLQWNASIEQSLGSNQSVSASYVGAAGRRLLHVNNVFIPLNGSTTLLSLTRNGSTSDYKALQLQYQRRLSRGFQALVGYTFSKSMDSSSTDSTIATGGSLTDPNHFRGPSNFDVRHNFSGALTYDLPMPVKNGPMKALFGNWSVDSIVRLQSAPPINILVIQDIGFGSFNNQPDSVSGQPFYITDPSVPKGKRINPAAFSPVLTQRLGTLGRNVVRGFGSWQVDMSLRRKFNLSERFNVQFRAEFFNIFNHPNFFQPSGFFGLVNAGVFTPLSSFGRSSAMMNRSPEALNSLHQTGGPRSIQFGLRLEF